MSEFDTSIRPSRRQFLKAGTLAVGFSFFGAAHVARAISPGPIPGLIPDLKPGTFPDPKQLDTWLVIHKDNTATLYSGRVEIGQGGPLGLLQIAAEELDLRIDQIKSGEVETGRSPETGETDASSTIEIAGGMVRQAAAEARQALLALASTKLGVAASDLSVDGGVVSLRGGAAKTVTYGELIGEHHFDIPLSGKARQKSAKDYRLVGTAVRRQNVLEKVTGQFTYVQHIKLPGMLHGRVVRPRGQGPYGTVPQIASVDESSISDIPGAQVIRRGNFLGVVAPREWDAVKAAQQLSVQWKSQRGLRGTDKLHRAMRASQSQDSVIERKGDAASALRSAKVSVKRTFEGPYQAHAPFAPNCAVAHVFADGAQVFCTTQGVYVTRMEVAKVIKVPQEKIVVRHVEGSGTYGPSCYHDVAQAAAIMSESVGKPVRVQFMRWDEFGWDNYGPAHLADVKIAADTHGRITGYQYDGWQHGWIGTEMSEELSVGTPAPDPGPGPARVVNKANAGAMYDIPNRLLNNHHISAKNGFLRGNPLRSPVDLAISFASEQAVDELSRKLGKDPFEFRRLNVSDDRWLGVLDAVEKASGWVPTTKARSAAKGRVLRGRGVALGTHFVSFGAAVADVEVDTETGVVRVVHLYGALDAGLVVNPGLVESQIIGMLTQATSRMLKEEVTFDESNVTSLDWSSYPVLRFDEHPEISPIIVQRINEPSTGAGEEVMGAAGAAIANAVFDATGVRFTRFPLTPERVKVALKV